MRTARFLLRRLLALIGLLGVGFLLWGFWLEPGRIQVQSYRIATPGWPETCRGLRIAVITDLHVGSPGVDLETLDDVVELTRSAQPDLVLLAGDYVIQGVVGGLFVAPEDTAERLAPLSAPMGVFSVLGNHDWWHDGLQVAKALIDQGIPVLHNKAVQTSLGPCSLWIAGVGDITVGKDDLQTTLSQIPDGESVVLLTHSPDLFPSVPAGIAIAVAGHTHGGQVSFPIIGPPLVPSRYGQRYAAGHIIEDGKHFFVSPGVGTSILPLRFGVPPEISILEIWPQKPSPRPDR